jgi:hypothetical protein
MARSVVGGLIVAGVSAFASANPAHAEGLDGASEVVKLWPNGTPDAKGNDPEMDVPTLSVFLPKPGAATGSAVVV